MLQQLTAAASPLISTQQLQVCLTPAAVVFHAAIHAQVANHIAASSIRGDKAVAGAPQVFQQQLRQLTAGRYHDLRNVTQLNVDVFGAFNQVF